MLAYQVVFGVLAVSIIWYFLAKMIQRSRGINVDFALKEIPPNRRISARLSSLTVRFRPAQFRAEAMPREIVAAPLARIHMMITQDLRARCASRAGDGGSQGA